MLRGTKFVALFVVATAGCNRSGEQAPQFVGSDRCASCHASEAARWKTSQHALAMQDAKQGTVLGNFDSAQFTSDGITSRFFRRGSEFVVNTEGDDGKLHDYPIRWTFGVYPLQQYLIELNGGRAQVLNVAWDTRTTAEGGQRWFIPIPVHGISSQDPLHWTGRRFNWNYTCADCHSTAVRKGYNAARNEFKTTFAEINVACEACHGPGSRHASWARYPGFIRNLFRRDNGLAAQLTERHDVTWTNNPSTGTPTRSAPRRTDTEIEMCAQCHARRLHIADGYTAGAHLTNYYIPQTITSDLYYPDGQQKAEVYNYGSFVQSRMYSAGVTCSDCHDPHSSKLRATGNQVCAQCHIASKYDSPTHHHHPPGNTTAPCVGCHMPARLYMEIDARRDHSMRIPRPDRSQTMDVPNACASCHAGKDAQWAAQQIKSWYPNPAPGFQRFAEAFAADDRGDPSAAADLAAVANDSAESWFARASALGRLASHPSAMALQTARAHIRDTRPLVRLAALQIAEGFGADERLELAVPLLSDSTRAVRQGAAWIIAPVSRSLRNAAERRAFQIAARDFIDSQNYNADQPTARVVLGVFYLQLNQLGWAEAEFRAALKLDPGLVQADSGLAAVRRARR